MVRGEFKRKTILSVMTQYTPVTIPGNKIKIPNRALTYREYNEVLSLLDFLTLKTGLSRNLIPEMNGCLTFQR